MHAALLAAFFAVAAPRSDDDSALLFVADCMGKGKGNFFLYHEISTKAVAIEAGDALEYDVQLAPGCPEPKGGIDFVTTDGTSLRDSGATDQDGLRAHGDADLSGAVGKWLHRKIALEKLAGKTTSQFLIQSEGDTPGRTIQFIDAVRITHDGKTRVAIYENGKPDSDKIGFKEGYSKETVLAVVPRADVDRGTDTSGVIARELARVKVRTLHREFLREVAFAEEAARRAGHEELLPEIAAVRRAVDPESHPDVTAEAYSEILHQGRHQLDHTHPFTQAYTGYLVGHAHIDFQWLWEWPETLDVCKTTFGQATRFMDEFPEFCFSQSSPALYLATEENFPDVFEKMKKYVAAGRWDIVGGRWCEGDTNIISAESHARHLLYGQRYFREKFGKTAVVGWEPDTFGHCATMPAILRAGGLRYYYFCRAGKGKPLFQWEAPDGSKVLAFDEPATGSWYNSDVTGSFIDELMKWEDATVSKDLLWVYGVGNHGGGPTREQIATALDWQKQSFLPTVKFATAETFFTTLEKKADLSRIPTIKDELNFVFRGCYTTHGDMKRWNRDAEVQTVSAESLATCAWLEGAPYPGPEFARSWKDITWNHHHDTLPGTSIHPSYDKSRAMFEAVLLSDRRRIDEAARRLASSTPGDPGILVVNSLPFPRREWVEVEAPESVRELARRHGPIDLMPAAASDGGQLRLGLVVDAPALGSQAIALSETLAPQWLSGLLITTHELTSKTLRVAIDPETGTLTSIRDKTHNRELLASGSQGLVFEVHWEKPHGMSAWQIGEIERVEPLLTKPEITVVESGVHGIVRIARRFHDSTITTDVRLTDGLDRVDFDTTIDWKEKGGEDHAAPFLKVAFPLAVSPDAVATYEIPFGAIERPRNGDEVPALRWVDVGDKTSGVALLNDSKHGHSVKDNVLRLSLVRASYYPDAEPDQYVQRIRYALVPHKGSWKDADIVRRAASFNTPLVATMGTVAGDAQHSFLDVEPASVIPTGVKKAEDQDAVIVRIYESRGDAVRATLTFDRPIVSAETVNFVEDPVPGPRPKLDGPKLEQPLRPYEIQTLRVRLAPRK